MRMGSGFNASRQHGLGIVGWLAALLVAAFVLTLGFRLLPVYMDYWSLRQVLNQVMAEPEVRDMNQSQLRAHIQRRLDVNRIETASARSFRIVEERGQRTLDATYESRVPFMFNIDLVVRFDDLTYELPRS